MVCAMKDFFFYYLARLFVVSQFERRWITGKVKYCEEQTGFEISDLETQGIDIYDDIAPPLEISSSHVVVDSAFLKCSSFRIKFQKFFLNLVGRWSLIPFLEFFFQMNETIL